MNSCQTMGIWVVNNHYISSIGQSSYLTPELTISPKRRSFSWKTPYSTCVSYLLKEGAFCGWILCPSPSLFDCLCLYLFLWLSVIQLSIINYHLNSTNQLWLSNLHLSVFRVFLLLLVPGCLCTLLFFAAMTLPSHPHGFTKNRLREHISIISATFVHWQFWAVLFKVNFFYIYVDLVVTENTIIMNENRSSLPYWCTQYAWPNRSKVFVDK